MQVQPPNSCANVMGEYFPRTLLPRLKNEGRPNIDVAWRFACRYSAHPLFQRHHPPCPPLPRHAESNWGFEPWASGLGGQEPSRGSDCPAMVNREGPPRAAEQLCSNQRPASPGRPAADLHGKLENHKEKYCFSAKSLLRPSNSEIPNNNWVQEINTLNNHAHAHFSEGSKFLTIVHISGQKLDFSLSYSVLGKSPKPPKWQHLPERNYYGFQIKECRATMTPLK